MGFIVLVSGNYRYNPSFSIFADRGYLMFKLQTLQEWACGDELSNNIFFPKQKILYNKKQI